MNKIDLPHLLLLPGLLCNDKLWTHQVNQLNDICIPHVADLSLDDSVASMVKRILEYAPKRFALAGLSMGGYVAFEMMRQAPERVICLALLDTMARLDEPERLKTRKGLLRITEEVRFLGVTPRLLPTLIYEDKLNTPVANEMMGMAESLGKEVFIRQQTAIINRPDSVPLLKQIDVPTLVVVGENDQLTPPSESIKMAQMIPNATLQMLPKCGHLPPLELPNETTALLRKWLVINT